MPLIWQALIYLRTKRLTTHSLWLAVAISITAWVMEVGAQQPHQLPVVGVLMVTAGPLDGPGQALRAGLRQLGYVEGQNVKIEFRSAKGQIDRLERLAQEIVDLNVNVIVAGTQPAARAAQQATSTIPIVAVFSDHDPVASGLVNSLSRPGSNITGVFTRQSELVPKRLQLLKEAVPRLSRVVALWDSYGKQQFNELEQAARPLGVAIESIELHAPYDLKAAFRIAKQKHAEALIVFFSPVFYRDRVQIAALALEAGLPTMNQEESWVVAGGFISYGPTIASTHGRAAYFVDRLLKGAKPGDLPIEQASNFKLTVNLRTAKALRLIVPQSIVLRADEIIR